MRVRGHRWHILAGLVLLALSASACGSASRSDEQGQNPSGASGSSGASSGGGGPGTPPVEECVDGKLVTDGPPAVETRTRHHGTNGDFTDTCDGENLVEYECALTYRSPGPGIDESYPYQTGEVESTTIDCVEPCRDGTCPNTCPSRGDPVTYLSLDDAGSASFEDTANGITYACALYLSSDAASFDCTTALPPGSTAEVIYSQDLTCAGNVSTVQIGREGQTLCYYRACAPTLP